jgi:hypothetical protein
MYASFLGFCAPYIWTFLNSLFKIEYFNKLLYPAVRPGRFCLFPAASGRMQAEVRQQRLFRRCCPHAADV